MFPKDGAEVQAFGLSHVGKVRSRNEDAIYIDPAGRFALVADGMGGHRGGRQASQMAAEGIRRSFDVMVTTLTECPDDLLCRNVANAIKEVSFHVAARGQADPDLKDMGTTVVVWALFGERVLLAHAGDSRAYLLRAGELYQMTADHSLENEQLRAGVPYAQINRTHMRHMLFRNVGLSPPSEPSVSLVTSKAKDLWLLCSDGLSNKLSAEGLRTTTQQSGRDLPDLCKKLVEQAYEAGGEDNISVIALAL